MVSTFGQLNCSVIVAEKMKCLMRGILGERSVNPAAKRVGVDRSRLAPLVLDYTRLSRPKPNREPVRRLSYFGNKRLHACLIE